MKRTIIFLIVSGLCFAEPTKAEKDAKTLEVAALELKIEDQSITHNELVRYIKLLKNGDR